MNKQNGKKLRLFEINVILPLFEYMISYKQKEVDENFDSYLEQIKNQNIIELNKIKKTNQKLYCIRKREQLLTSENKKIDLLIYICKRKYNKKKFLDSVDKLLRLDEIRLRYQYYCYLQQKRELKSKKRCIDDFKSKNDGISLEWQVIFCDFYYKKFFTNEKIWSMIGEKKLTRDEFHDNFRNDNNIYVCPYCDLNYNHDVGILEIEHFLPKSKYPFLAMNPLNLYSACVTCNKPSKGKGDKVIRPITMPYYEDIGRKMNFFIDITEKKISIKGKNLKIENYIHLLQLQERYSSKGNYEHIQRKIKSFYQTLKDSKDKKIIDNIDEFQKYIEEVTKPKECTCYFILSDFFKNNRGELQ
ncbi:MAG: hypothetical protein KHX58_01665 [Coprobacillus sp.]|nr:hypothetical protein [Coprobacillus sp.]